MSKKKIFYVLSVFLLLGVTMSVLNVRAHPPINVDMEYYVAEQHLSIHYTHGVSDPAEHYIYRIDVWVNVTQVWEDHEHHTYFDDHDNYAIAVTPLVPPTYIFTEANHPELGEQPTHITPITTSHTIALYILEFPAQLTGEPADNLPIDKNTGLEVPYLGEGRTNITVKAYCTHPDWEGNPSSLTEHYYVGLPYYNPHLSFAEAAIPGTVSTIVVLVLLFTLPKLGQKNLPEELKQGKNK